MNSNSRPRTWFFAAACLVGLAAPIAHAQNFYVVSKTQSFYQSSSSDVVAHPVTPFTFSVESPINATLALPSGSTQALTFVSGDNTFQIRPSFATKAAMDAAFPNGTYRLTGTGIPTLSFNLTADAYPADTPQVTNGTWNSGGLLVVNPAQTTTINLSTFTGYATSGVAGHMQTRIQGLFDNVRLGSGNGGILSVTNPFGIPVQTTPLTSITIPAGTLTSGRVYEGEVQFDTATTLDTATVPGGGLVALFTRSLTFLIAAQAPGTTTPPPVIASQPANQTGVAGGTVTFNLNVTVGGSSQFNNLGVRWFFNGREVNYNDGNKYSLNTNGFGLTVKNLIAADVGTYTVTLITAGGVVTSNAATLTLAAAAAPTVTTQPVAQTVSNGSTVVFAVSATGTPAPTYQWRKDGVNIANATSATLVVPRASAASAGNYSVSISNSAGTTVSSNAALIVTTTSDPGRLTNLSVLTDITEAVPSFTVGTVIGGAGTSGTKSLVVRAVGPSLGALGVPGTIADPKLELFSGQTVIASNDNWGSDTAAVATLTNAMASVGAFAFIGASSKDAAVFQQNLSGPYTVKVSGVDGASGTAIAEIYDATAAGTFTPSSPRLINVSVLKTIPSGGLLTLGFTVGGSVARTVLIRVIGPGLAAVGVTSGTLGDPQLTLFNSSSTVIATNDDWGADPQLSAAGARVNAFSIGNAASKDSMLIVTLPPGGYTAQARGNAGTSGIAIVEVYEVP